MDTVIVVGAGPVGLATADQLADAGKQVVLVSPAADSSTPPRVPPLPETFRAAAAFWTPFASGVSHQREAELCQRTLEFYRRFSNDRSQQTGVRWRTIEQLWIKEQLIAIPAWLALEGLAYRRLP